MKKLSVLEQLEVDLISEDRFTVADRVTERSSITLGDINQGSWSIDLIREGLENKTKDNIFVCLGNQDSPGVSSWRPGRIPNEGLNPSSLSSPLKVNYSYINPETNNYSWIGQDNYNIKTYIDFKFSENETDQELQMANPFMFEHDSVLYLVAERVESVGELKRNIVTLYKLQEDNTWATKHKFQDPIDIVSYETTTPGLRGVQAGSPCGISYDGSIYISYRSIDRNAGTTNILTFKIGDEVEKICVTQLLDTPDPNGKYNQYRLRMASGGGQLMMVSYGIYTDTYDIRDMRTFISFDEGYTFKSNSNSYKNVLRGTFEKYENTPAYFFIRDDIENRDNIINCNVNFSLHFDDDNMCFVMFKGGDGTGPDDLQHGVDTLIGLVSFVRNPFVWEQVARLEMDSGNIGIGNLASYVVSGNNITAYDPIQADQTNWISIDDIVSISNGKETFLFLSSSKRTTNNTSIFKIRLCSNSIMPKGYSTKLISLGQKIHPELLLLVDPADPMSCGFLHEGNYNSYILLNLSEDGGMKWKNLVGSFYRNQFVTAAQITEYDATLDSAMRDAMIPIYDRWTSLAIHGKLSNLAEEYGYQLSYPARMRYPQLVLEEVLGSGSGSYDENKNLYIFTDAATPEAYLTTWSNPLSPSIVERASASIYPLFKTRFQVEAGNIGASGEVEVFRWIVFSAVTSSPSVVGVRCYIKANGDVYFRNQNGSASPVVATIDPETKYDFSIITDRARGPRLTFSYKRATEDEWSINPVDLDYTQYYSGPTTNDFRIGLCSASTSSPTVYVGIGDIHLSNYGVKYFPSLTDNFSSSSVNSRRTEPVADSRNNVLPKARAIHQYNPFIVTRDGSKYIIKDHREFDINIASFLLRPARNENHITNIEVPNATLSYNFSTVIGESEYEELLFRNTNGGLFNAVGLIHGSGISDIKIRSGLYDENNSSWISSTEEEFEWTKTEVQIVDNYDDVIVVDLEYQPHELRDRYLWIYDEPLMYYREQIKIIDNEDSFITLETAPDLSGTYTAYIPEVNSLILLDKRSFASHIQVSLKGIINSKRSISKIEIGTTKTLEDAVSQTDYSIDSDETILTSDRNYSFNSYSDGTSLIKEMQISMPNLVLNSSYYNRISSSLRKLKEENKSFSLIEDSGDELVINYGTIKELSYNPDGKEVSIDLTYCCSTYRDTSVDYEAFSPSIDIIASEAEIVVGRQVVFSPITGYSDETGLTYRWLLDGSIRSTATNFSHTPAALGERELTLEVTDENGVVTSKTISIYVRSPNITDYNISATPLNPHTVTLTGIDDLLVTVPETGMRLYIERINPAPVSVSTYTVNLTDGVGTTIIDSTAGLTKIYFVDSEGTHWVKEVNLT